MGDTIRLASSAKVYFDDSRPVDADKITFLWDGPALIFVDLDNDLIPRLDHLTKSIDALTEAIQADALDCDEPQYVYKTPKD